LVLLVWKVRPQGTGELIFFSNQWSGRKVQGRQRHPQREERVHNPAGHKPNWKEADKQQKVNLQLLLAGTRRGGFSSVAGIH